MSPGRGDRSLFSEPVDEIDETKKKCGGEEQKMKRLVATLDEQFAEGAKCEKAIRENLRGLGYGR